ncbi:MAG: hypothetical protein IJ678_09650 [Kiritimatiellae bacterium]|nr:hypothetical protein [Kiritimatiellia bacterium]MBR1609863.1 hypothetical protein [Kiritimatiellia bacterium]
MKNTIPLVLAVLLGLAAAFSVNKSLNRASGKNEDTEMVVFASVKIEKNKPISKGECKPTSISKKAYLPGRHIPASDIPRISGLKTSHAIPKGSPILYDDLQTDAGQSDLVGVGEFVVAVKFRDSPLMSHLKPNDEIAIAAMQNVQVREETGETDETRKYRYRTERRLSVLFPCEKVLDVSNGSILVSAPPEKALQLVTASQNFPLYPLLRRTDDMSNMDVGVGGSVSWEDLTVDKLKLSSKD